MKRALLTVVVVFALQLEILGQGSLTPSAAPAATMKTLDQIEPRIDLAKVPGNADSSVLITNSGSYYLSTNLVVTKSYGIYISAPNVVVDLNGFEIVRASGTGGEGIYLAARSDRAVVRNGTIRGFTIGISSTAFPHAKGCLFENLAVAGCAAYAIYAGESSQIVGCRVHDNNGSGIVALAGSMIRNCTAQDNQGSSAIYTESGTISECTAKGNRSTYAIRNDGGTIIGCTAEGNVGLGPSSYGIYGGVGSVIIACVSKANSNTNSPAVASHGVGIFADSGSTIKNCSARENRGDGIQATIECLVEGNTSSSNGNGGDGAGIRTLGSRNRIEANTVTNNDRGIDVDSTGSLIIRNSASGNTINFDIAANNKVGPIVAAPNSAAISGSTGGSGIGTTDPWANISF